MNGGLHRRTVRGPMKTKAKLLVGLVVFTLIPVALVLIFGKGPLSWSLFMVAAILGTVGATFFLMMFGLGYLLHNAAKGAPEVPLEEGEEVLTTIPGNHLEGFVSHGGRLRVTTRRLVFLPHRFNFKLVPVVIPWADVDGIALGATAEFALMKVALVALATTSSGHGLGTGAGRSDVLRVRHGRTESRFVVVPDASLLQLLNAARVPAQ
jgi:hypothetical protein